MAGKCAWNVRALGMAFRRDRSDGRADSGELGDYDPPASSLPIVRLDLHENK